MDYGIECWTPEQLSEERLTEICNWLMALQKAYIPYSSLKDDLPEHILNDPNYQYESWTKEQFEKGMEYVQDLIRHLHFLKTLER